MSNFPYSVLCCPLSSSSSGPANDHAGNESVPATDTRATEEAGAAEKEGGAAEKEGGAGEKEGGAGEKAGGEAAETSV